MSKAILVLGATGKQGGCVLRALLAHPKFTPEAYTIYAATRDPASESAKRLAALSQSVKLVTGDLRSPIKMFKELPTKPWAVFAMTYPGKTEAADGINTIDAAVSAGASHFVFASVDRGQGSPATDVPHFITKHEIEAHLKNIASKSNFTYTILRPVFFADNLEPGFFGRVFATLWKDQVKRPLAIVNTEDVGKYGAAALLESDSSQYRNAEYNLAGDLLTFKQADEIFKAKTGQNIPTTYSFFVSLLFFVMPDIKKMSAFFNNPGFLASPQESSKVLPMGDFKQWIDKSKHVAAAK